MSRILIFGAHSAIAQAVGRCFAQKGDALLLVGRNAIKLQSVADDLRTRGASRVEILVMDALDYDKHAQLVDQARNLFGGLDIVLIAHGTLPDQQACQMSFEKARREFDINTLSVISLLTHMANYFESERCGTLAVISSVAGDRGRQSNYLYGATKGAVTIFLQGLRNRLHKSGVQVVTIKPGFVNTPMTAAFQKGPLWVQPEKVAEDIVQALHKRRSVVYTPWFWRYIMWIIRSIPEAVFKRMSL